MKNLTKKVENRIMVRLFAFMSIGAGISAAVAYLLTIIPEYRRFLYVFDAENQMILSASGWILLLLPLMMFLALPKERGHLSFAALLLNFGLFSALVGAALSGVSVVYVKADIARSLLVSSGMFAAMALTGMSFRRDMISWHCILLTAGWGLLLMVIGYWLFPCRLTDIGVSIAAIVSFCAVTAYSGEDIQRIIAESKPKTDINRTAIRGALAVYLNLVGLVVGVLRFWGSRGMTAGR